MEQNNPLQGALKNDRQKQNVHGDATAKSLVSACQGHSLTVWRLCTELGGTTSQKRSSLSVPSQIPSLLPTRTVPSRFCVFWIPDKKVFTMMKPDEGMWALAVLSFNYSASLKFFQIRLGAGRVAEHLRCDMYVHSQSPREAGTRRDQPEALVLTLSALEGAKDFALGRHPFDVGMVFKG